MYPVPKTIYAFVSLYEKRSRKKDVTVSLFAGVPFIWFSLELCTFSSWIFSAPLQKYFVSKDLDKWS